MSGIAKENATQTRLLCQEHRHIYVVFGKAAEMLTIQLYVMELLLQSECEKGKCLAGGIEIKNKKNIKKN